MDGTQRETFAAKARLSARGLLHRGLTGTFVLATLFAVVPQAHAVLGTTGFNGMLAFPASGTWTAPMIPLGDNITHALVVVCGGGGGSGGQFALGQSGGGAYGVIPITPGATYTITVGPGGQSTNDPGSPTRNGGTTSIATSSGQVLAIATGAQVLPGSPGEMTAGVGSFENGGSGVTESAKNICANGWLVPSGTGAGGGSFSLNGGAGYAVIIW